MPGRLFRCDFAIRDLAVEVDGGLYVHGGHTRGAAREADYERDALAMKVGWRPLRVSPRQIKDGRALAWILALIEGKP